METNENYFPSMNELISPRLTRVAKVLGEFITTHFLPEPQDRGAEFFLDSVLYGQDYES